MAARRATRFVGVCYLCDKKIVKGQWYMLEYEARRNVHTRCRSDLLKSIRENNP